jgi:hypothetical protein
MELQKWHSHIFSVHSRGARWEETRIIYRLPYKDSKRTEYSKDTEDLKDTKDAKD